MPELDLSFQEAEELLEGVINNKKLIEVDSNAGKVFVVFSFPNSDDTLMSRYVRRQALIEAAKEELPSRADIEAVIKERQIGKGDSDTVGELEAKIKAQERLLNLTKIEARRAPIQEALERYTAELSEITAKSDQLFILTQEFRADEESLLYLAFVSSYKITGERYWPTFDEFEEETDLVLRNSLVGAFTLFNSGASTTQIRYLSRHVLWRIKYTAGLKIGGPLFPRGLYDLTSDQQSLLYWSNYYQSIYEMLPDDQPSDDVIRDDDALDAYMEGYFKQREEERGDGRLNRRTGGGKLSSQNSDEVIVTANHPEYLQTVYSEQRIKAGDESAEVAVVAPNSRRAQNQRAARRNR